MGIDITTLIGVDQGIGTDVVISYGRSYIVVTITITITIITTIDGMDIHIVDGNLYQGGYNGKL